MSAVETSHGSAKQHKALIRATFLGNCASPFLEGMPAASGFNGCKIEDDGRMVVNPLFNLWILMDAINLAM